MSITTTSPKYGILVYVQDILLSLLLVLLAILSLFSQSAQLSVILFGLFGSVLAIIWLRLSAPDLAIVELLLGAGVSTALMMKLAYTQRAFLERISIIRMIKSSLLSALFFVWMVFPSISPPDIERIKPLVLENLKFSGVESPVTAVLLNFRGYDTLLEVLVITIAIIGVLNLNLKQKDFHLKSDFERSLASILLPPAVFFSFYITYLGFSNVGGAFQGGVLLAGAFILMALTHDELKTIHVATSALGLFIFTLIAIISSFLGKGFLYIRGEIATYSIMLIELGILISTGALLFFAFRGRS
ncbi:MAG: DUF4040 domain-containing protein [Aquificaceae bacterium]|nr:DUF4040 domain-containing protein [Aquificaceae bacterium]MDW8237481.1 DUF4040 domain-containing protein [Aquificaceae bacterium]